MKLVLHILLFVFLTCECAAQDPAYVHDKYFFLGLSLPFETVRDLGHSPLRYRGLAPTLRLGFESINPDYVSRVSVAASFGVAKPSSKPRAEQNLSSLEMSNVFINYSYYKRTGAYNTEGSNRYWGGALTMTIDVRNYNLPSNNLVGYQVNTSLNMGFFYQEKLKNNKWHFNYETITPFISYAMRPNYLGMLPTKGSDFNAKSAFIDGKIVTFNKLFRFYNRFSFDQQINDHRQRRINYSWDYHWNTVSRPMKSVVSGLGYETMFKM